MFFEQDPAAAPDLNHAYELDEAPIAVVDNSPIPIPHLQESTILV